MHLKNTYTHLIWLFRKTGSMVSKISKNHCFCTKRLVINWFFHDFVTLWSSGSTEKSLIMNMTNRTKKNCIFNNSLPYANSSIFVVLFDWNLKIRKLFILMFLSFVSRMHFLRCSNSFLLMKLYYNCKQRGF